MPYARLRRLVCDVKPAIDSARRFSSLGGDGNGLGGGLINLHGFVLALNSLAFTLTFALFELFKLILAFALEVDAAILRHLVLGLAVLAFSCSLGGDAAHFGILAVLALSIFGGSSSLLSFFLLTLFGAVVFLVSGGQVSLGLLRRELGGGRSFRVPGGTTLLDQAFR